MSLVDSIMPTTYDIICQNYAGGDLYIPSHIRSPKAQKLVTLIGLEETKKLIKWGAGKTIYISKRGWINRCVRNLYNQGQAITSIAQTLNRSVRQIYRELSNDLPNKSQNH